MEKIKIEQHGSAGLFWFAGWLFTLGFVEPALGEALLALLIWPYYLGAALSALYI